VYLVNQLTFLIVESQYRVDRTYSFNSNASLLMD